MPNQFDRMNIRNSSALTRREGPNTISLVDGMIEPQKEIAAPEDAITRREDGALIYKRFVMTTRGLVIPDACGGEEWADVGRVIQGLETSISWVVGDWALYAMQAWELTAAEIAEGFGYEPNTIEVYTSVCRRMYGLIRNQALSFGHARLVAPLDMAQQETWLAKAAANDWTVSQLREAMHPRPLPPPVNWKSWRTSSQRLEKALSGKLDLSHQEFEGELQKFVNQARVLWAQREREE